MNKKKLILAVSGITGAAMLAGGCAPAVTPSQAQTAQAEAEQISMLKVEEAEAVKYDQIANVNGKFRFNQNTTTPADEVFNLFGTAATAMCAKPGFAFGERDITDYYVNLSGSIKLEKTISLTKLAAEASTETTMKCSCSTGGAIANVNVKGVPLNNIIELAQPNEDVQSIIVKSSDGYGMAMPISFVMENEGLLVYKMDDKELPADLGNVQLWMPNAAANYFTRQVTEVEFSTEPAQMKEIDDAQRAKVSIVNRFDGAEFKVGDLITFEGYADDFDVAIAAVEFSMDGGATWTACETPDANTLRWVYWMFDYQADTAGTFKLDVRARTADNKVSPLGSSVVFTVK